MTVAPGDFVDVPLGTREAGGVVWDARTLPAGAGGNLKAIAARRDLPPLREPLRRFVDWIAHYTLAPRGMVLRMVVRAPEHAGPEPRHGSGLRSRARHPPRMTPARARVLAALAGGLAAHQSRAGAGGRLLDGRDRRPGRRRHARDGGAAARARSRNRPTRASRRPDWSRRKRPPRPRWPPPSGAGRLLRHAARRGHRFGQDGGLFRGGRGGARRRPAGADPDARDRPDRRSFSTVSRRASARAPAEWHSGVGARRRARIWDGVVERARCGWWRAPAQPCSCPSRNSGWSSSTRSTRPPTSRRRASPTTPATWRWCAASSRRLPVVLASATPSIETRVNRRAGPLPPCRARRPASRGRALPDLAADRPAARAAGARPVDLAAPRATVAAHLARGEQALLFLNRRGYAPLTLCRACGHRFQCPNCTAWLVEHRFRRALRLPPLRPCRAPARRLPGMRQRRLADRLRTRRRAPRRGGGGRAFPMPARWCCPPIFRAARSACGASSTRSPRARSTSSSAPSSSPRGTTFPHLTLVGVVDADLGLANGDPRAAERTFQLLHQVTGRAGRGDRPGRGLVQTWQPDHPVMRALLSGDAARFYARRQRRGERAGLPPFGRLAALVDLGRRSARPPRRTRARWCAPRMPCPRRRNGGSRMARPWTVRRARASRNSCVLGPAEAPIAVMRGRYRFRLLVRAERGADLQGFLREMLAAGPPERGGVRVAVDVDPQSFL